MSLYEINSKNKYYTLYADIREDILRGKFKAGEKLPAKRTLAAELGVSVVTVQLAYEQLLAEGYIYSRERSGYYVEKIEVQPRKAESVASSNTARIAEKPQYMLDFVKGSTPGSLFRSQCGQG